MQKTYDYAIAGLGAAGLHLICQMIKHPFFADKTILIIEPDDKSSNDRTWSFWEGKKGNWDDLVVNSWNRGLFASHESQLDLDFGEYWYKTIRSEDFYAKIKGMMADHKGVNWVKCDLVDCTEQQDEVTLKTTVGEFKARFLFDSTMPEALDYTSCTSLKQHFLGWFVEFEQDVFDPDRMTMMDYRLQYQNQTSFTYVLPFSPTFGLVEFTFFSHNLVNRDVYKRYLSEYITEFIGIGRYKVREEEYGVIPMTTYPFHRGKTPATLKIGTAGGWVRPSTGYSFKRAETYARKIVQNITHDQHPGNKLISSRFRIYDQIFLRVLANKNYLGPLLFEKMYSKNDSSLVFKFLDEETSLREDIQVISTFKGLTFMKALFGV